MGATGNPNAARLAALQERKKTIEESLAKCNQELRQLCIQEADLTGTVPLEMPLEPGESPPSVRRRVGTAYQLPENLVKNANNKDESVSDLELQVQVHANMAEAALGLANEQNISKTLRRQHMAEYQQHKLRFTALQEKLSFSKERMQQQNLSAEQMFKQKKKPRPTDQDDNVSVNTNLNDPFGKLDLRQSVRSNKCPTSNRPIEQRYSSGNQRLPPFKSPENSYLDGSYPRNEEVVASGLYRLSINGYKNYMERRENMTNIHMSTYNSKHNALPYNQHHHNSHMQISQHSPQLSPHYQQNMLPQQLSPNLQHNIHVQQQQHRISQSSLQQMYNYSTLNQNYNQIQQDYNKYNIIKNHNNSTNQQGTTTTNSQLLHRQSSSPNPLSAGSPKLQYYSTYNLHGQQNYRPYSEQFRAQNPHQLQPHQQYEQNVMTSGLGGCWKRSETGEMIWCNTIDSNWQRDKRFGSLDRRKNKRIHKRVSPNVDNRSATMVSVPTYSDHVRTASIKSPQAINRKSQDNRQLVRTQSLGSVGAQTVDSVWPSDDNSSCESDNRSINDNNQGARRQKQKEWMETTLDGPVSPTHSIISRSQSAVPSILSPEEKYIVSPPQHIPPPPLPKATLEIPAESNPSPRLPETNVEIFNNNIPKNCTIVQAGHCKPYHEETKPFEMSDFYKYSTKFKKSPIKQPQDSNVVDNRNSQTVPSSNLLNFQKNLNDSFDEIRKQQQPTVKNHHSFNHVGNANSNQMDTSGSLNSSLDLSQIANANVAEHFSDEMNAWYKNQRLQIDNNNAEGPSKGKSTATLV